MEFVCPSVTSDGFKEVLGSAAAATATTGAFQAANPWVRYQGIGHGFAVLDVTPERVQTDFFFIRSGDGDKGLAVHPRTDPAATVGFETSYASTRGSRQISGPVPQLGPRSDSPRAAGGRRGRPRRR